MTPGVGNATMPIQPKVKRSRRHGTFLLVATVAAYVLLLRGSSTPREVEAFTASSNNGAQLARPASASMRGSTMPSVSTSSMQRCKAIGGAAKVQLGTGAARAVINGLIHGR